MLSRVANRLTVAFEVGGLMDGRLLPMEGLRGLAVTLVFFVHFGSLIHPWIERSFSAVVAEGLQRLGNTGVDLFFALSGYLIYGSLIRRPQPFLRFMGRRIQRIYPAFAVVLTIYIVLSLALPSENKVPLGWVQTGGYLVANALLLPGIFNIQPMITVAWSLSYELFFYLVIPLVITTLALRLWNPPGRIVLFFVATLIAVIVGFPYPRMYLFGCGMVLSEILPQFILVGRRYCRWLDSAAAVAAICCATVILAHGSESTVLLTTGIAVFLLCLTALSRAGPISTILVFTPLRWLGNMSYSYYLIHGLILKILFFALAKVHAPHATEGWLFWLLLLPSFGATLIGSAVLFLLIEKRFSLVATRKVRYPQSPPSVPDAVNWNQTRGGPTHDGST